MAVMTNKELAAKLKDVATNYKTLYVMGCFGAPMTEANKARYCNNHSYNKKAARTAMIKAASADTFGFDCVCLIKGILWGWNGNKNATYGGAKYASNGVPDIGADSMITKCSELSTNFNDIEAGEAVWMRGHIGVYIGDGLAVECTPSWENKVQITACNCTKSGYKRRNWTKHGKLPYIEYVKETVVAPQPVVSDKTEYNIGDVVEFTGTTHYTSSYATAIGKKCKPGKVKITAKRMSGKHPYHGVAVSGGGSTAYGWLNASDIEGAADAPYTPAKGDKVKITKNAPVYGKSYKFSSWVYNCTLFVREVQGSRIVVSTQKTGAVTGAVDKKYLTKV